MKVETYEVLGKEGGQGGSGTETAQPISSHTTVIFQPYACVTHSKAKVR